MKGKTLAILAGTAAVLVVLAAVSSRERGNATRELMGRSVLEGIVLNDISSVIIDMNGESTTIAMKDGMWGLPAKHNYPVDMAKLRKRLLALVDMKVGQVLDVDEAQKAELKLAGAEAGSVRLLATDGAELAVLLLGAERQKAADPGSPYGSYPEGRYVSSDAGKTALLVADTLSEWTTDPMGWLDNSIVSVPGAEIMSIRIRPTAGEALELARAADGGDLALTDIAPNEELDSTKLSSLQNALSYLNFDDIADPALDDAALGFESPIVFEATTSDDTLYLVKVGGSPENSSARYCRISVSLLKPAPAEGEEISEADLATAKEKVEALNTKLANWTFVVPSYKAESLTLTRDDLVEQQEEAPGTTDVVEEAGATEPTDEARADEEPAPADAEAAGTAADDPQEADTAVATTVETASVATEAPVVVDPTPDVEEAAPEESLGVPAPKPLPASATLSVAVPEGPEPQK